MGRLCCCLSPRMNRNVIDDMHALPPPEADGTRIDVPRRRTPPFGNGITLLAGTVVIIGICYAVAAPRQNKRVVQPQSLSAADFDAAESELLARCHAAAEEFRSQCEASWSLRVCPPFILAGDLTAERLDQIFEETVVPTTRALQIDYFDQEPEVPIRMVILSSDESYRRTLERFGQSKRAEYSGLYQRRERTILVNLSTGAGTLAHELTHALAHADFPEMPEWFDEGLASLHEESEFSADGRHLLGGDNWRIRFLREADQRDCWKTVAQLLERPFAEPEVAALDYALARNLCLFLQDRGVLPAFYRKCRSRRHADAAGRSALLGLFPGKNLAEIDHEFRDWVSERKLQ